MVTQIQDPSVISLSRFQEEQTQKRALMMVRTIASDPVIAAGMHHAGYTSADSEEAWALLKAAGQSKPVVRSTPPAVAALAELETWRSVYVPRAQAMLQRLHPAQEAFVFEGLSTGAGTQAVVDLSLFLDRLNALESSPERKSTRKADHAALATLGRRGITVQDRKRMRHLIHMIENPQLDAPMPAPPPDTQDERTRALVALHAWVADWSETARGIFKRRDQLIRLGIGKRQKRKSAPITAVPATPTAPPVITLPTPTPVAVVELPTDSHAMLPASQKNGASHG